jgi:phosphatidylglycerophosphate synthase
MIGGALQLNAANGGVVTQRSVIDPTRSYTVSVWVNMTNTNGTQTFVSLPGSDVSNFYLQRAGWLNGGFVMDVFSADSSSSAYYVAASTTIPVANRWYHVTGVHDAEARQVRVYVDGRLEGQAAAPNGSFANSGPLAFGYSKYSGARYDGTDARLDDVRVYNRALTSAEVAAVFQDTGTPAAAAPVVAMTAPAGGTSYTAPATVSLSATATTTDGTIARVEFYNGGTLLGTDTAAPYSFSWSSVAAGTYTLTARAVGSNGQATVSAPVSITVTAAAAAPVVAMTAPAGGTSYTAPATVSLSATATTTDGTIARVEFYNGGTLLGTDTTAPYTYSWSGVAAGSYTLTARAVGSNGQATVSAPASITVTTAVAPVVAMTAPAGGTSYTAPATVSLSATATTTDGTIARVEFYNGGTLLGTDTAAPYSFSWSSVAAGTYTLTARAVGSNGQATVSAR